MNGSNNSGPRLKPCGVPEQAMKSVQKAMQKEVSIL